MAATEGANYDVYVKSSAVDAHQLGSCECFNSQKGT